MLKSALSINNIYIICLLLEGITFTFCDVQAIKKFLDEYNRKGDSLQYNETLSSWNYEVKMTKDSKEEMLKWSALTAKFSLEKRQTAKTLLKDAGDDVPRFLLRQLKLITRTATSHSASVNNEVRKLQSKMTSIYSKTVVSIIFVVYFHVWKVWQRRTQAVAGF